jgi:anti-anti-sigma factor
MGVHWQISEHVENEVVILRLTGRGVFVCEGDGALWLRVKGLVTDGYVRILLNVQSVDYIDSFSLGEIVQGFKAAQHAGGRFGICHLVPKVRGLFVATKLIDVIPLFETEAEGILALSQ